jgi:hypothetical protein
LCLIGPFPQIDLHLRRQPLFGYLDVEFLVKLHESYAHITHLRFDGHNMPTYSAENPRANKFALTIPRFLSMFPKLEHLDACLPLRYSKAFTANPNLYYNLKTLVMSSQPKVNTNSNDMSTFLGKFVSVTKLKVLHDALHKDTRRCKDFAILPPSIKHLIIVNARQDVMKYVDHVLQLQKTAGEYGDLERIQIVWAAPLTTGRVEVWELSRAESWSVGRRYPTQESLDAGLGIDAELGWGVALDW